MSLAKILISIPTPESRDKAEDDRLRPHYVQILPRYFISSLSEDNCGYNKALEQSFSKIWIKCKNLLFALISTTAILFIIHRVRPLAESCEITLHFLMERAEQVQYQTALAVTGTWSMARHLALEVCSDEFCKCIRFLFVKLPPTLEKSSPNLGTT